MRSETHQSKSNRGGTEQLPCCKRTDRVGRHGNRTPYRAALTQAHGCLAVWTPENDEAMMLAIRLARVNG